jgi:hypothetical protein
LRAENGFCVQARFARDIDETDTQGNALQQLIESKNRNGGTKRFQYGTPGRHGKREEVVASP